MIDISNALRFFLTRCAIIVGLIGLAMICTLGTVGAYAYLVME